MTYLITTMEKLKLKNRIIVASICIILCLVFSFKLFWCDDNYLYENKLTQILGVGQVKIKDKSISDSWAIGEWYICEIYYLTPKDFYSFLVGSKQNKLYSADNLWFRKNWEKLPVDSQYNEVKDMIINYRATKKIELITNEMKQIISNCSGFYSFLCQPTIENPQKVLFFLLDEKTNKLFVVDLKL